MATSVFIAALALLHAAPAGILAYVSGTEQQDQQIHLLDLGTGESRAVGAGSHDNAPAWSPDGTRIAYHSKTDDGLVIRVVTADGSEDQVLAHETGWNHDPQWSSDGCGRAVCETGICGRYLLYTSASGDGLASRAMVHDTQTGTETAWAGGREGMMRPVWLPTLALTTALRADQMLFPGVDTRMLLQELEATGGLLAIGITENTGARSTEVFLVTAPQAAPLLLWLPTMRQQSLRYEEWNIIPDRRGRRLAYESNDGGNREIYVLHRRGFTNVSNHRAADWNPAWSPDGNWLAFQSFREGRSGIYRVFPDTALVQEIDASPEYNAWAPVWSPDSKWVAYVSDASGDPELYVARAQGEDRRRLTRHPGIDDAPAWRPEVK